MSEKLKLVVASRDEMVEIGKLLGEGIDMDFAHEKGNRLKVLLDGDVNSGKSIITDVMFESMFDELTKDHPKRHTDDMSYLKEHNGEDVSISFSSSGYRFFLEHHADHPSFSSDLGGVEFHQNIKEVEEQKFGLENPSLRIWVEGGVAGWVLSKKDKRLERELPEIQQLFRDNMDITDFGSRYIELEVNDPRLLNSEKFMSKWSELAEKAVQPSAAPLKPSVSRASTLNF